MKKITKILIANRGEIAVRVIKTARKMGIATVAVFSDADRSMPFVRLADFAVNIGSPKPSESYLNITKILDAAKELKCDAIHPGYGFLSENSLFAKKCEENGIIFIGPRAATIEQMGDKLMAKRAVREFNIPLVPGTDSPVSDPEEAVEIADEIGYPVMIKASAGGGGKGMRIVREKSAMKEGLELAMSEAKSSFGDPSVFIEKFIEDPRHIEVQIMADGQGNVIHLNERECSIQRRHQKVIEESPSPIVNSELREQLGQAAVGVAKACSYVGAGTVEFIMDQEKNFYFLEMNTRLQVEHPVTEFVTGLDLVKMQIEIAEGKTLSIAQDDVQLNGHAIELRVSAEDPEDNFSPSIGLIRRYEVPEGAGVRVDNGYEAGIEVPVYYDPLISKLIVYADTREKAVEKMSNAIDDYHVEGVTTTLSFGKFVMQNRHFIEGDFDTNFISRYFEKEIHEKNELLEAVAAVVSAELYTQYQENLISVNTTKTNWRSRLKND